MIFSLCQKSNGEEMYFSIINILILDVIFILDDTLKLLNIILIVQDHDCITQNLCDLT